ncbi:MAG: hypothetical protein ABSF62_21290 [Bryobacteraceae bacterium]
MQEVWSLSAEQKRSALQAVLDSETLARSDQLRSFMRYVGEMAIAGRAREITEYLIAVEALGRPSDFSPADDSSVRGRAHELRRKLQKYYETENPNAEVRIVLPKGLYFPRFVPREEPAIAAPPGLTEHPAVSDPLAAPLPDLGQEPGPELAPAVPLPQRKVHRFSRLEVVLASTLSLSLLGAGLLAYNLRQESSSARFDPIIASAWGPLTKPDADVLLCVATLLHMVVRPYMAVVPEGFPKYPAPPELYAMFREHRPLPNGTELDMHPVDNSVQMGHVSSVVTLANVLHEGHVRYQVLPERVARVTTMRGRNVILIGDPQDSEAAALYLEKAPITLDYDPAAGDVVIRDRRPGQARVYVPKRGPDKRYTEVYGLITVIPTPGAAGDQRSVVISGLTSVGSQGAAEFFSSSKVMKALLDRLRKEGYSGFPSAYQVVVHCNSSDTLLLSTEYQAHAVFRP